MFFLLILVSFFEFSLGFTTILIVDLVGFSVMRPTVLISGACLSHFGATKDPMLYLIRISSP